jgi:HPt (histidine-containing phosphotransfer) domain-containing protein
MGVRVELDLDRVAKLESILGAGLSEIVGSLVASMSAQIEQAERALVDDRLRDVTQAAHCCRNDALMVGAQPMLAALTELEDASRSDRLEATHVAMQRLRDVWPQTRDELQRVVHGAVQAD